MFSSQRIDRNKNACLRTRSIPGQIKSNVLLLFEWTALQSIETIKNNKRCNIYIHTSIKLGLRHSQFERDYTIFQAQFGSSNERPQLHVSLTNRGFNTDLMRLLSLSSRAYVVSLLESGVMGNNKWSLKVISQ